MSTLPPNWYIITAVAILAVITFMLRALPFALLEPLRQSPFVLTMSGWMPVGILLILATSTFSTQVVDLRSFSWALIAVVVTGAVHLLSGRRTLYSVGLGTVTFVGLMNFC